MREGGFQKETGSPLKFPGQEVAAQGPPGTLGRREGTCRFSGAAEQSLWVLHQPVCMETRKEERGQGQVQAPLAGGVCALGTWASSSPSTPPLC